VCPPDANSTSLKCFAIVFFHSLALPTATEVVIPPTRRSVGNKLNI
jgi:hypothetical protein